MMVGRTGLQYVPAAERSGPRAWQKVIGASRYLLWAAPSAERSVDGLCRLRRHCLLST